MLVIVFDFVYAVFLNTISLEITPFALSTIVVLTLLAGLGIGDVLKKIESIPSVGSTSARMIKAAFCLIPAIFLLINYALCDQSLNYTAYEYALNILRTVEHGNTLFLHDDNNVFPVAYSRIVEKMRKDIKIYDHFNLIFKLPNLETEINAQGQGWEDRILNIERRIMEENNDGAVFYAALVPKTIRIPEKYQMIPYGLINKVVKKEETMDSDVAHNVWEYYSFESFNGNFYRDYMNREVAAFFHFNHAKKYFALGRSPLALKYIRRASEVGYNDVLIHTEMAVFLIDQRLFEEGRKELEKATIHYKDLDGVHENWGYYYFKIGDYNKAVTSFQKAVDLRPDNFSYYNNLGYAFYEGGRPEEAYQSFQRSLSIEPNQPNLQVFLMKHGLGEGPRLQEGRSFQDRKKNSLSK